MSHFGKALDRILSQRPRGFAAELARKIDVSPAYICRLRNGTRTGIYAAILSRLVRAVTDSETERAQLIAAHMQDESCGYCPKFIEIAIKNGNKRGNKIRALKKASKT